MKRVAACYVCFGVHVACVGLSGLMSAAADLHSLQPSLHREGCEELLKGVEPVLFMMLIQEAFQFHNSTLHSP